jgi:hypothetical protein
MSLLKTIEVVLAAVKNNEVSAGFCGIWQFCPLILIPMAQRLRWNLVSFVHEIH